MSVQTLVIQPGHWPRSVGSTGTEGEQEFALDVAQRVKDHLESYSDAWEAVIIEADSSDADYQGDAFVAIHADGASSPHAYGASTCYQTDEGRELAEAFMERYIDNGYPHYNERRAACYTSDLRRYYGVREAVEEGNIRAAIIEAGFLTNADERAWLESGEGKWAVARSIIEAVTGTFATRNITGDISPMPLRDLNDRIAEGVFEADEVPIGDIMARTSDMEDQEGAIANFAGKDTLRIVGLSLEDCIDDVVDFIKDQIGTVAPSWIVEPVIRIIIQILMGDGDEE